MWWVSSKYHSSTTRPNAVKNGVVVVAGRKLFQARKIGRLDLGDHGIDDRGVKVSFGLEVLIQDRLGNADDGGEFPGGRTTEPVLGKGRRRQPQWQPCVPGWRGVGGTGGAPSPLGLAFASIAFTNIASANRKRAIGTYYGVNFLQGGSQRDTIMCVF